MPDGLTHLTIGLIAGATLVGYAATYAEPAVTRALLAGTCLGLIITPDLDQESATITEQILRRIPIVGFLFQVSWYGYALLFRHRGWSHHIIVGTLSRIAWSAVLFAVWSSVALGLACLWDGVPRNWLIDIARPLLNEAAAGIFIAWWLQDALHILADSL